MARATAEQSNPVDTGERILRAALKAFAENGFDGATTRDIAHGAGVPLGLLQYHFGNKAKLWEAAVEQAFAELRREFAAAVREARDVSDEREVFRHVIRRHVGFVSRNPEFVRLMHDEGKRRGPRMRWLVDRHVKPMFEALIPLVSRFQDRGILPADIAPFHFAYILIGSVDVMFHQAEECKRALGIDPADPEIAEAHARAIESLFLGPASKG